MHYLVIALVVLALGIGAVVLVAIAVWIVFVLTMRFLAVGLGISIITALTTFAAGVVWGIWLPLRAMRGSSGTAVTVVSPAAVQSGQVFTARPTGAAEHFGWDRAWPLYAPYQLRADMTAVRTEARRVVVKVVAAMWRTWPSSATWYLQLVLKGLWILVLGVPTFGLAAGISAATGLWLLLVWCVRGLVSGLQRSVMLAVRGREAWRMKRKNASIPCAHCYRRTTMPSYVCSDAECSEVHRDVSPGPLGLRSRICVCAEVLPMTVSEAAKTLTALCPYCDKVLPPGSGGRRVVVAPVFGSVGAGKTQFLAASLAALRRRSRQDPGDVTVAALSDAASDMLATAVNAVESGGMVHKTPVQAQPSGAPFLIERAGEDLELHLMDASGEKFVRSEESRSLAYLDIADTLIFLLDPLALQEMREKLVISGLPREIQVAQGTADGAYGSVVDRLRDSGDDLRKKRLAIVLTKADVVNAVVPDTPIPGESEGIRDWLHEHGGDALVRRSELDFAQRRFFAVDSAHVLGPDSPLQPLRVMDWVVSNHGGAPLTHSEKLPPAEKGPRG